MSLQIADMGVLCIVVGLDQHVNIGLTLLVAKVGMRRVHVGLSIHTLLVANVGVLRVCVGLSHHVADVGVLCVRVGLSHQVPDMGVLHISVDSPSWRRSGCFLSVWDWVTRLRTWVCYMSMLA